MEHVITRGRREFVRHPSEQPVEYRLRGSELPTRGRAKDVGRGGICFASDVHLSPGTVLELDIPTPDSVEAFVARVAWCEPADDGHLVGVSFFGADEIFHARSVEQVCQIEAYRRAEQRGGRVMSAASAASEWIALHAPAFPSMA